MATHLAIWLRVTPPPSNLAESSAIFKHLKKQGRISAFIRKPSKDLEDHVASYYATFQHDLPSLQTKFKVSVYHNSPNPQNEDPFNIRGLQSRKPLPKPVMFSCQVQRMDRAAVKEQDEWMRTQSPYAGQHFVHRPAHYSELHETYLEADAPEGVAEALATFGDLPGGLSRDDEDCTVPNAESDSALPVHNTTTGQKERLWKQKNLRMDSILKVWKQARAQQKSGTAEHSSMPTRSSESG